MVQDLLNSAGIETMFLPPVSSPLNPIEKVWAQMKRHWTRHLTELDGDIDKHMFQGAIEGVLEKHVVNNVGDTYKGSYREWLRVLNGELV